eukprot:TRINITY_DN18523_c4_g1_i1.p1 TRINITY_DN18523_c4_g1~~TRINITY_DN18523_c4_g1_i1.p1  ORF type:complete len:147 (+),score=28.41 TRINITY_DN18523_c4_g1_i1:85-525(+)
MGVRRTTIKEGDGKNKPKPGDVLQMHYTGTFAANGQIFDSSHKPDQMGNAGKPLQFTIGHGQVIRGWDVGVAEMSLGEKAKLQISSDFAYGRAGIPRVIPPNADLDFEVELLAINDLTAEDPMDAVMKYGPYACLGLIALKVCGCL